MARMKKNADNKMKAISFRSASLTVLLFSCKHKLSYVPEIKTIEYLKAKEGM